MSTFERLPSHPPPEAVTGATGSPAEGQQISVDAALIETFARLVDPLGGVLPDFYEVALHDLQLLPNSLVAVSGDVTGRKVGDPATDLLLRQAADNSFSDEIGYYTKLPDGRCLLSSTMIIRNFAGEPVAALCINADISTWQTLERISSSITHRPRGAQGSSQPASTVSREIFPRDVDELAAHLLSEAIRTVGVPVELMKKEHKIAVVRSLKGRGIFMLREAVEIVATALQVTRFTIYNYLNEINDEDNQSGAPVGSEPSTTEGMKTWQ